MFLTVLIAATACLVALPKAGAYAEESAATPMEITAATTPTEILKDFVTKCPDRTSGSEGEKAAAEYIAAQLSAMGYAVNTQEFNYRNSYTDALDYSRNVVAVKNAGAGKRVIIGAHYDNLTSLRITEEAEAIGGDGTCDNGSGVATLLAAAYALKDVALDYELVFVAFGAEQLGLYGSRNYTKLMTDGEKENTLLMINYSSVGVGDYLYMYCDELKTAHGEYFEKVAAEEKYDVLSAPSNRNVALLAGFYEDYDRTPYQHVGLTGDNSVFLNEGINTVSFFGYNWTYRKDLGGRESAEHPNLVGTPEDMLQNYLDYYGETGEQKMQTAVKLTVSALTNEGFVAAMDDANANKVDYSVISNGTLSTAIYALVLAALIVFAVFYYKKLEKIQQNSQKKTEIFEEVPKEEEKVFEDF